LVSLFRHLLGDGGAGLGDIEIYFNSAPFKYHYILAFCLNIVSLGMTFFVQGENGHDLESSAELNKYLTFFVQ